MGTNNLDVAIVGGGITGLWVSSALQTAGYNIALFEQAALGNVQTLSSQGIIHGGTKYALTGKLTGSSEAVRAMPGRWKEHLAGDRQPDLSEVKINTPHQWMWDAGTISSKVSNFFASKLMSSRVQHIPPEQLPSILKDKSVHQLQEPVLDVRSVLQILASEIPAYQAIATAVDEDGSGRLILRVNTADHSLDITAGMLIYAAGEGNEKLQQSPMQKRPLHMVMVKGELPSIWGHVIEANANPRLTMTTHFTRDGQTVWYIGGQLAEDGALRDSVKQIEATKKEVTELFPGIDWAQMSWATLRIDRAEGLQPDGARPTSPVIRHNGSHITVWPTKLVFAPMVADEVLQHVKAAGLRPSLLGGDGDGQQKIDLPSAVMGEYPWDTAEWQ